MHRRRQKAAPQPFSTAAPVHNLAATQPELVNNPGPCQKVSGSFASGPARSSRPRSPRASRRSPAGPQASVPTSERTTSHEDPVSGRLRTEAQAEAAAPRSQPPPPQVPMATTPQAPFAHFASIDWAKHKHHALILNPAGHTVAEFDFAHSATGWQEWREQAARFAPLAVAISDQPRHRHRPVAPHPRVHHLPAQPQSRPTLPRAQSPQRHQK